VQTRHNKRARNDDSPSAEEDLPSAVFRNEGRALGGGEDGELESRQPLFGEQPDNLTSPAIPTDDGELDLERAELIPTVIEVGAHLKTARGQEADFTDDSDAHESS
ncbi:hypothetical protein PIB30_107180, partial [Stylosanthes scabra]|nr:hypothetical protein [Stylosanthes scabra]